MCGLFWLVGLICLVAGVVFNLADTLGHKAE